MIDAIKNFDFIDWLITGGLSLLLTSTVTILVMLIKQKINSKSDIMQRKILNESTMTTLVGLGTDIGTLLTNATALADGLTAVINIIQESTSTNKTSIVNLASFVLECFNESNLSDEKKTKLQTLFEKTFFTENAQLIEALKAAKANSDAALFAANKVIDTLQNKIEEQNAEIASQPATRKRRV